MSTKIYANGREIACKASSGKTIGAFPDVCFTPPQAPPTPLGVPIPYPNTAFARDTAKGTKQVKIVNKEVYKGRAHVKVSTGDEAGSAPKKGVVTGKIKGRAHFQMHSMNVKAEGKNLSRHLDITTSNHGGAQPGNTPPTPHVSSMDLSAESCKKLLAEIGIVIHGYKDRKKAGIHKGDHQSDHILQNACFMQKRGGDPIASAARYSEGAAPCIILYDGTDLQTEHGRKTKAQREAAREWRDRGRDPTYREVREKNLAALRKAKPVLDNNSHAMECIKIALKEYFEDKVGLTDSTVLRTPGRKRSKPRRSATTSF